MAILSPYSSSFLDTLFCNEEQDRQWSQDGDGDESSPFQQDLSWGDEELVSLFTKQQEQQNLSTSTDPSASLARKEAVDWILKVKAHYGFTPLTAILAINYVDRFLSSLHFQNDKPWMIQLVAVTCLSLAAKVEETRVPLLLDLQVEDTKFLFDAKNIQKMELLVMSTLKWRMNPVTPISFLDHIVRRLHLHWDFFKKCEALVLCLVSDSRFVCYKPSVLATTAMLCVVDEVDPSNSIVYKSQLLDLLKTTKESVDKCYKIVMEVCYDNPRKREPETPLSPAGVIDFRCGESSNDSWESSTTHHFHQPALFKKTRMDQPLPQGLGSFVSLEPFVSPLLPHLDSITKFGPGEVSRSRTHIISTYNARY